MRALPEELLQKVRDLDAEGLLGRLPLPMVEKDIHLTDVLARLSTLEVRHAHFKGLLPGQTAVDDGIKLIFCGGTSLSKAHGIIERMSEDVDIKVMLTEPDHTIDIGQNRHRQPKMLKSDVGARARLKALHAHLLALFQDMDLALPSPFNERTNPHVRDSHRYLAAHVQYDNRLGTSQAIRPALKIEMIHRHPRLDLDTCQFGYLHERVAGLPSTLPAPVQMQCVGLAETIAEKTISLLRRAHWNWSGGQDKPLDPTLVRHIYDVHEIVSRHPEVASGAVDFFADLVAGDQREFAGRDPAFDRNARGTLLHTLDLAQTHPVLSNSYQDRLIPLIYAQQIPEFKTALATFTAAASRLIEGLPQLTSVTTGVRKSVP